MSSNLTLSATSMKLRARLPIRRLSGSAVLAIIAIALLYPLIDAVVGSFLESGTGRPTLSYWSQLWSTLPVARDMAVSAALSVSVVALVLLIAVPCGYALAKLRFRGAGTVTVALVGCMMIPIESILIPEYINFAKIGLVGTIEAPILVYVGMGCPFAIFMMTSYFRNLPDSIIESALVDGAGQLRAMVKIVLPLAKPALAIVAVLQFLNVWNDLLIALLFLPQQVRTIGVGLATLGGLHAANTQVLVAGSVLSAIPPMIVYLLFQRHLISGLTVGAEK